MIETVKIFTTARGRFAVNTVADAKMAAVFGRGRHPNEEMLELLSAFITKESIVVDGGAHIGTVAVPLAAQARKVIAFEPDSGSFNLLRENAYLNGASVDLRNKGLGPFSARASMMCVRPGNAGSNTLTIGDGSTTIAALDAEVSHAHLIKLDVEGMEYEVLQGATRLIKGSQPTVYFEVNLSQLRAHAASLRNLESFFRVHNYRLYIPLQTKKGAFLGRVPALNLVTLLIMPGAYLLKRAGSTFDVIAIPKEKVLPLPCAPRWKTVSKLVYANMADKICRARRFRHHRSDRFPSPLQRM
jgi:FkbM family methyltransferase